MENFVVDGFERAYNALETEVRRQVSAEFAQRMSTASFWERLSLAGLIEREIKRRIMQRISPDSLY